MSFLAVAVRYKCTKTFQPLIFSTSWKSVLFAKLGHLFVSEACSGSVTRHQCPACYSGALFMPSFVPFHLVFMCCACLLDGLADMNNSHQLPGHAHLTSKWKAGTHNPFFLAQSPAYCFDVSLHLPWEFRKISHLDLHITINKLKLKA